MHTKIAGLRKQWTACQLQGLNLLKGGPMEETLLYMFSTYSKFKCSLGSSRNIVCHIFSKNAIFVPHKNIKVFVKIVEWQLIHLMVVEISRDCSCTEIVVFLFYISQSTFMGLTYLFIFWYIHLKWSKYVDVSNQTL